jgi:DNA-binding transcriptional MocR family regulator
VIFEDDYDSEYRNVDATPLNRYCQGPALREGLQLGFAALDLEEIRRGVRDLVIALEYECKRKGLKR